MWRYTIIRNYNYVRTNTRLTKKRCADPADEEQRNDCVSILRKHRLINSVVDWIFVVVVPQNGMHKHIHRSPHNG